LLVVPEAESKTNAALAEARADLGRRVRALRRSVHVRHIDCRPLMAPRNGKIAALLKPAGIRRSTGLGNFLYSQPRHADLLLIFGPRGSAGMAGPVRTTYEAMPDPRVVVAVGTDAASAGW